MAMQCPNCGNMTLSIDTSRDALSCSHARDCNYFVTLPALLQSNARLRSELEQAKRVIKNINHITYIYTQKRLVERGSSHRVEVHITDSHGTTAVWRGNGTTIGQAILAALQAAGGE